MERSLLAVDAAGASCVSVAHEVAEAACTVVERKREYSAAVRTVILQ